MQIISILFFVGCILSCGNISQGENIRLIECPEEIANLSLDYAIQYSYTTTEYELGGQDMLDITGAKKLDCSGLVVNCYKYAVLNSGYILPFDDASVLNFYHEWSKRTVKPRHGDLIFMGEYNNTPSHMSIFVKKEGGYIYFIDSTYKPESGINGVSERFYVENDPRFLSFGIMLLQR